MRFWKFLYAGGGWGFGIPDFLSRRRQHAGEEMGGIISGGGMNFQCLTKEQVLVDIKQAFVVFFLAKSPYRLLHVFGC